MTKSMMMAKNFGQQMAEHLNIGSRHDSVEEGYVRRHPRDRRLGTTREKRWTKKDARNTEHHT